jgi:hypothetical protein
MMGYVDVGYEKRCRVNNKKKYANIRRGRYEIYEEKTCEA